MDKVSEEEDYMLYAVLNGGAPYLVRDGAYQNTDGSFAGGVEITVEEQIERCKVVSDLHEKVAKCEMVRHEMVDGNPEVQSRLPGADLSDPVRNILKGIRTEGVIKDEQENKSCIGRAWKPWEGCVCTDCKIISGENGDCGDRRH